MGRGPNVPFFIILLEMINLELVKNILDKIIDEKIFIVDLKINPNTKITLYLDSFQGITLDECTAIHRRLAEELRETSDDFLLEVSSPGLTSNLIVWQQYAKLKDKQISINTTENQSITGTVTNANETEVSITLNNNETLTFQYNQIKKAKPIINF